MVVRFLKILFWVILGVALLLFGILVSTMKILRPERLTPLTEITANKILNAEVSVGRVELKLRGNYPFINIEVDSLIVISRDIKGLPREVRDTLPAWGDTLVSVDHFKGGINLAQLALGNIYLNDLRLDGMQANMLVVNDKLNNFTIMPETESDTTATVIPDIRIKSFELTNPKIIRYSDLSTGTYADLTLQQADLSSEKDIKVDYPVYDLKLNTNFASPLLGIVGQTTMPMGCDGTVNWEYRKPFQLRLNNFTYIASLFTGRLNAELDFEDDFTIKELELTVNPVSIDEALSLLPDSVRKEYGVPKGIKTDMRVGLNVNLTQPYNLSKDALPYAQLGIDISECYFRWQQIDLRRIALDTRIDLQGSNLDAATVDINDLLIAGPATTIKAKGNLSNLISDPKFDGNIDGNIVLERLPSQLTKYLDGAMAKGTINIDASIQAAASMFSRDNFHKIKARGTFSGKNLYYLAADTQTMYTANSVKGKFGTDESVEVTRQSRRDTTKTKTVKVEDLFTAKVAVDSAQILVDGLKMQIGGFSLGVGALNTGLNEDTTIVIPMGGKLSVERFSLLSLSDSAVFRLRELNGNVAMRRYKGDTHLPLFTLEAAIKRMATGDNSTRFMVTNSQLRARINKLPDNELSAARQQTKRIADSIAKKRPDISPDSVYVLAREIRRANTPASKHKRVHAEQNSEDIEILDWGTTRGLRRFLLDWKIRGTLTAERAGLYTSSFPVRNRVKNFNIKFNNDSVVLENVGYKAGQSDFLISGNVSNIKRALTSRQGRQSLKVVFDMLSDTINVNELANAFFTGAANTGASLKGNLDDEKSLEQDIFMENDGHEAGPLLIPVNIDAEFNLKANHVLYSDFMLNDLTGKALMYDGALNLSDLRASSNVGSIDLSALYSAPTKKDMRFGFAMDLNDFNIHHFLELVPAMDSIMPLMKDLGGIIGAKVAATSDIDQQMNLVIPTLNAAISITGDSLVVLDQETFKKIAKWLFFKDKHTNMIKHMSVEMTVKDNVMQLYPFMFDFDRYTLGVQGRNDLDMNFDYHIAVLKSPLPFKFGINIKGNTDKYKIRLGRAHFNEKESVNQVAIADTTRVNLIKQFQNVFRRGVRNSQFAKLDINQIPTAASIDLNEDTISRTDSLYLIQNGLLPSE